MNNSHTSACRRVLLVIAVFVCFAYRGVAENSIAVQKIQIADGIYQFISADDGYVATCNSIVVVNDADVLVFDTFSRASTARTELAEIRKITNKPVRYVVNSHHHPDHWSGNEVYAEAFPGLEIISTEASRNYMQALDKSWPPVWTNRLHKAQADLEKEVSSGKNADGSDLTPEKRHKDEENVHLLSGWVDELMDVKRTYPTLTYVDHLTLRHGGREFRLFSITGDATGTTALYLPREKLLMTGDAVSYPVPGSNINLPLSQFYKSLRTLAALGADVIIPGHGPAIRDRNALTWEADLVGSVIQQVDRAVKDGLVTVEQMQKVVNVDAFRSNLPPGDKETEAAFRHAIDRMVDTASREARDGRKWESQ
jgi:cyclase